MFTKEQKQTLYKKKSNRIMEAEEKDANTRVENILKEINEIGLPYENDVHHNSMRKLVVKKLRALNLTVAYSLLERIMSMFVQYDVVFTKKSDWYY